MLAIFSAWLGASRSDHPTVTSSPLAGGMKPSVQKRVTTSVITSVRKPLRRLIRVFAQSFASSVLALSPVCMPTSTFTGIGTVEQNSLSAVRHVGSGSATATESTLVSPSCMMTALSVLSFRRRTWSSIPSESCASLTPSALASCAKLVLALKLKLSCRLAFFRNPSAAPPDTFSRSISLLKPSSSRDSPESSLPSSEPSARMMTRSG
ncbi:Uncharacterised protein [Enterobacter hormaechei]|nr:Uncharacterised protein [Enterobacter hormaechei]